MAGLFCAIALSTPLPTAAADGTGMRTAAIVSLVGDTLILKDPGSMWRSSAPDVAIQTGAGLDDYITAHIRDVIAGQFTVVDGAVDPNLLQPNVLPQAVLSTLPPPPTHSAGPPPDVVIVVYPVRNEAQLDQPQFTVHVHYEGTSLTNGGLGFLSSKTSMLSVQYAVAVIDTHSGAVLKSGVARLEPMGLFRNRPYPIAFCDDGFWPKSTAQITDAELAQIRIDLKALVAGSLPNALYEAGLVAHGTDHGLDSFEGHRRFCN